MEILKHPAFVQARQKMLRPFQPQHMAGLVHLAGLLLNVPKQGHNLIEQFYRPHILKSLGSAPDARRFIAVAATPIFGSGILSIPCA